MSSGISTDVPLIVAFLLEVCVDGKNKRCKVPYIFVDTFTKNIFFSLCPCRQFALIGGKETACVVPTANSNILGRKFAENFPLVYVETQAKTALTCT
jgi:hypothetical protein